MTKPSIHTKTPTTPAGSVTTNAIEASNMTITATSTTAPPKRAKLNWTRLNYKGIDHDNRRLVEHRAKNCECHTCYRELHKLPPAETYMEKVVTRKSKLDEREIKRAKKKAKKEIKAGKQSSITMFFK